MGCIMPHIHLVDSAPKMVPLCLSWDKSSGRVTVILELMRFIACARLWETKLKRVENDSVANKR